MTPTSSQNEFIYANGHRIGKLAQSLFPGGTEIEHGPKTFDGMIEKNRELIVQGASGIYEATLKRIFRGQYTYFDPKAR